MIGYDFFCGAGGLTRGLLDAGIRVVAGFDCDRRCQVTYEKNNPGVEFVLTDLRRLDPTEGHAYLPANADEDILFAACAPCQPFSPQRKGSRDRRNATLLGAFGCLVERFQPSYVLVENVPGIMRVRGFSTFRRFCRLLRANGYEHTYAVLNAKHFGVAQNRRRLVLLATKHGKPSLPEPTHGTDQRPLKTVREAISRFPAIAAGDRHPEVPNHVAASVTPLNFERLKFTPPDGGDRRTWPERLHLRCHRGDYQGHTDVYGRMRWDSPAPALTSRCNSISNGRYGHPEQNRAISLREAAAIQSFPDGYEFFGTSNDVARQIGNAVPVRLAERLGKQILRVAYENNRFSEHIAYSSDREHRSD